MLVKLLILFLEWYLGGVPVVWDAVSEPYWHDVQCDEPDCDGPGSGCGCCHVEVPDCEWVPLWGPGSEKLYFNSWNTISELRWALHGARINSGDGPSFYSISPTLHTFVTI